VHRSEAARASAPDQAKQERFRLIVFRVAECDDVGARFDASPFEERVARSPRCVFDGPVLARGKRTDIAAIREERPAERSGDIAAEPLVGVGGRAQLMVEMREGDEANLPRGVERSDQVRQRHRIGTAGQRDEDTRTRRRELVAPNRPPDGVEQLVH
jgi:hypothetical protein